MCQRCKLERDGQHVRLNSRAQASKTARRNCGCGETMRRVQILFNAPYRKKAARHRRWWCPCRGRKIYGLAASFISPRKSKTNPYSSRASGKHTASLAPYYCHHDCRNVWAVTGTAAWAPFECNHWRARSSIELHLGMTLVRSIQASAAAAAAAALQLESRPPFSAQRLLQRATGEIREEKSRCPNGFHGLIP